jgi:hypothetical protein
MGTNTKNEKLKRRLAAKKRRAIQRRPETPIGKRLFHYTTRDRLAHILADGIIKQATDCLQPRVKPAAWCSYNQLWEETANKGWMQPSGHRVSLNKQQTHELCGGLARIEVDPDAVPYDWAAYKILSGWESHLLRGLADIGVAMGMATSDWRCSFKPIPSEKWRAIELWDGEQWRAAPKDILTARKSDHSDEAYRNAG